MPVLEFEIFTLHPPHTPSSPVVKSNLSNAVKVLTAASGHPFSLLTQIESPNIVYLIGAWDSVSAHKAFLVSAENQKLLADAEGVLGVHDMYNVEMDTSALPLGAPVVSIVRLHVKPGMKKGFDACLGKVSGMLTQVTGGWETVGGRRIDEAGKEEGGGELLFFTGWESLAQHEELRRSGSFNQYTEIKEFLEKLEIRHALKYEV
ncbi:hypothetical protein L873DRAFT_1785753 [Choiromyces venosus 120613-1]|uniref:ABM domain-containing protein n=1 Tax=Choiromyces venosus 120613-1 TaxID=1336337 RepID=A0A3N4K3Y2_9PEZI|nr:hypothetical protein L873DRAFT_1785753 [Choiromyces venosus 120613-1]